MRMRDTQGPRTPRAERVVVVVVARLGGDDLGEQRACGTNAAAAAAHTETHVVYCGLRVDEEVRDAGAQQPRTILRVRVRDGVGVGEEVVRVLPLPLPLPLPVRARSSSNAHGLVRVKEPQERIRVAAGPNTGGGGGRVGGGGGGGGNIHVLEKLKDARSSAVVRDRVAAA